MTSEQKEKVKICVYAICKNEIEDLLSWLDNVKDCDYIAILDTGSTDGTYEKLLELSKQNKKIIVEQKIYKNFYFDKARNDSLLLVPEDADLCICLDFDERISDSKWKEKLLNEDEDGDIFKYAFSIKKETFFKYGSKSGKRVFSHPNPKKYEFNYSWSGYCSESLLKTINYYDKNLKDYSITIENFTIIHLNFDSEIVNDKKSEYYDKLLNDYFIDTNREIINESDYKKIIYLFSKRLVDKLNFYRLITCSKFYTELVKLEINHFLKCIDYKKLVENETNIEYVRYVLNTITFYYMIIENQDLLDFIKKLYFKEKFLKNEVGDYLKNNLYEEINKEKSDFLKKELIC